MYRSTPNDISKNIKYFREYEEIEVEITRDKLGDPPRSKFCIFTLLFYKSIYGGLIQKQGQQDHRSSAFSLL